MDACSCLSPSVGIAEVSGGPGEAAGQSVEETSKCTGDIIRTSRLSCSVRKQAPGLTGVAVRPFNSSRLNKSCRQC